MEQTRNYLRETSNIEPGRSMGIVEEQYILPEYSALRGILKDYSSICIQYGYAVMFMTVFPLGIPIFSLATNLRIRMDGWKFCQAYRRPLPKMAEDIGKP